jgi:hypothetical protein
MSTPEKVFKLQTQLSESSGTKKIAGGLIVVAVLLLIWASVDAIVAKESILRAVSSPLLLVALFAHMRSEAKRRTADLERQLEL